MTHISENARNVVECPFCKELVSRGALRCPHCHANLKIPRKARRAPFWISPFMLGVYTASIFWVILIVLYLTK